MVAVAQATQRWDRDLETEVAQGKGLQCVTRPGPAAQPGKCCSSNGGASCEAMPHICVKSLAGLPQAGGCMQPWAAACNLWLSCCDLVMAGRITLPSNGEQGLSTQL